MLKGLLPEVQKLVWDYYDYLRKEELMSMWKRRLVNVERVPIVKAPYPFKESIKIDYLWKGITTLTITEFYINKRRVNIDMQSVYGVWNGLGILRAPPIGMIYTFKEYLEE